MDFIIQAVTDIGNVKETNQDSLSVKRLSTCQGNMVFAVLCDGMGGLSKGEVASAAVVNAFEQWMWQKLPELAKAPIEEQDLKFQWEEVLRSRNREIQEYSKRCGCSMGTTAVVMLLTQKRYYVMNVGDSRAYELQTELCRLTQDQTLVAQEVREGILTEEQAKTDPRRSVLLQCVGASENIFPEIYSGEVKKDAVYFLCSDGFHHEISDEEIAYYMQPGALCEAQAMANNGNYLIFLDKQRQERDNISLVMVRTY